jgi:hypothetical protein
MPVFSTVQHAHDNWPVNRDMAWPTLAERLSEDHIGDKDGLAIICATFNGTRSSKTLLERGLIALDVEQNKETGEVPPDPESVVHYLMAKRLSAVLWTTFSSTTELPRYRIVLPLSEPLRPALIGKGVDRMLSSITAANLRLNGVVDRGKFGAATLMFLARRKLGTPFYSRIVEGEPINAKELYAVSYMASEKDAMREAQRLALKHTTEMSPIVKAKIERFNALHEVVDLLEQYGYRRGGDRFKSPLQHPSSQPATALFPGGAMWCSFSESDRAAGLGQPSDDCVFGDSFALYLHWEHRGNFRAALEAIALPEDWKDEHSARG